MTERDARVLPCRIAGLTASRFFDRLAYVTDNGREVRVRWQLGRTSAWRCDECGPMDTADCAHTFAAALLLAEQLLGLSRIPELHPPERTTT